jgi:hypothetical protein
MDLQIERPIQFRFAVKNGLKILLIFLVRIPEPEFVPVVPRNFTILSAGSSSTAAKTTGTSGHAPDRV